MSALRDHFAGLWAAQEARRTTSATAAAQHQAWKDRQAKQSANIDQVERELVAHEQAINAAAGKGVARPRSSPLLATAAAPYPVVTLCRAMRLPEPVPEYAFSTTRRWRFDYCWPLHKLALECDGAIWTNGRHSRGSGRLRDMEKMSEAAILGYRVIYCTPADLMTTGIDRVRRALMMTRQAA